MKKLFTILFLLVCLGARATTITLTLSITNAPTNGYTIANGADVRTWTNTITTNSIQIANTNTAVNAASNLFFKIAAFPFAGMQVQWTAGSSNVTFFGLAPLALTVSTNWASLSYTTNLTTNGLIVTVNAAGLTAALQGNSASQTAMASGIVAGINASATNPIATGTAAMANFFDIVTAQTNPAVKTFSSVSNQFNGNFAGTFNAASPIQSPNLLFCDNLNGFNDHTMNIFCTNTDASVVWFYQSTDYTLPLSQWTLCPTNAFLAPPFSQPLTGSLVRWSQAVSNNGATYYIAIAANPTNSPPLTFQALKLTPSGTYYTADYSIPISQVAEFTGAIGVGTGGDFEIHDAQNINRFQILRQTGAFSLNYAAGTNQGNAAINVTSNAFYFEGTNNNVIMFLSNNAVYGNAFHLTNVNATNLTGFIQQAQLNAALNYYGTFGGSITTSNTNTLGGAIAFTKFSNSALVNGVNQDIQLGTNVVTIISGPSGAFTNVGFTAGVDQQRVELKYYGGQSMTFISQSGLESTAANRLSFTGSLQTLVQTNVPAITEWEYNSALGYWELISHN